MMRTGRNRMILIAISWLEVLTRRGRKFFPRPDFEQLSVDLVMVVKWPREQFLENLRIGHFTTHQSPE